MYINIELTQKVGLSGNDLLFLTAIKQKETGYLIENLTEVDYKRFKEAGYIKHIKSKKKDEHLYISLRLTKEAEKLLNDLSYEGAVDEETITIADWIIDHYKNRKGGIVKNKAEVKRRIQWFKKQTGISGNHLALLITCAMNDTYDPSSGQSFEQFKEDNPRAILSNMADNLFWAPTSMYDKHKTLDKSPLYTYYEDNQEYVMAVWEQKLNEDGTSK